MLVVGLTGNIAAGKSAVAARLEALGATIVDADVLARHAVAPGTPGLAAIARRWGPDVLAADGSLDRAALRSIVFADAREREALNAIVHPEVERLRREALTLARSRGVDVVVCDIPLLFEVGAEREMDLVLLVDAPADLRRERLMRDRGLSATEAEAMIAAQLPSAAKRERAHHVIDNTGSRDALDAQVDALWPTLLAEARGRAESA